MEKARIFLTGVGGQGTLTATNLLAQTALEQGIPVTSGEIHGMAQRGGVVVSTVLLGGLLSPKIGLGEADILIGFEPLETYRALEFLAPGGIVVSSTEAVPPVSVSLGKAEYPDITIIEHAIRNAASRAIMLPARTLGKKAGAVQSGNIALLAAMLAADVLPFGVDALKATIERNLNPKIAGVNLEAADLGAEAALASNA